MEPPPLPLQQRLPHRHSAEPETVEVKEVVAEKIDEAMTEHQQKAMHQIAPRPLSVSPTQAAVSQASQ